MSPRSLALLIDGLEHAFSQTPKPSVIAGCPCCVDEHELAALLSTPRRRLTAEQLAPYGGKVLNTVGSPQDLRYFAPRLLELSVCDSSFYPSLELLFQKLTTADWRSWPEAPAIAALLAALWDDVLNNEASWVDPGTLLCALAAAEEPLRVRLTEWGRFTNPAAVESLHDFLTGDVEVRRGRIVPSNAFWDRTCLPYAELCAWLNDGAAAAAAALAFEAHDSDDIRELLIEIHGMVGG
ncbi:MAG: hypothetical protein HOQ24_04135 [Mycobacteriaceae bacterium]|nr:hypothetical protein [Mycobacteriaceae bacterium]